jgi:hypothetical protein
LRPAWRISAVMAGWSAAVALLRIVAVMLESFLC